MEDGVSGEEEFYLDLVLGAQQREERSAGGLA